MVIVYSIVGAPFYDERNQCYKKIIRINKMPTGNLTHIVKRIRSPRLSHFDTYGGSGGNGGNGGNGDCCGSGSNGFNPPCIFAIFNPNHKNKLLTVDELPDLMTFLVDNGYTIDTSITKMLMKSNVKPSNDLICYVSYP
jgi:hypothetical protein